jgi:hypothetical protein
MKDTIIVIGAVCSIANVGVKVMRFIKEKIEDKIETQKAWDEFNQKVEKALLAKKKSE